MNQEEQEFFYQESVADISRKAVLHRLYSDAIHTAFGNEIEKAHGSTKLYLADAMNDTLETVRENVGVMTMEDFDELDSTVAQALRQKQQIEEEEQE